MKRESGPRAVTITWAAFAALALASASPLTAQQEPASAPADTLTLEAALDAALDRDPELAAATAGVSSAAAGRREARAAWFPTLATSGSLTYFEEPMLVAPIHSFRPTALPEFDETLTQGRVTVGWTLLDGGARSARVSAAGARVESADAAAAQSRSDGILETIDAYLRVLGARDALTAQRAREDQLEAERSRADRLVREGAAPRLELLRAEAELQAARADGIGRTTALAVAEADLARLLGTTPERIAASAVMPVQPVDPSPTPTSTSTDHPLLRQARARSAAAQALAREARSAWLPRVQGSGAFLEYGAAFKDFSGEWQAGLQIDYPLFVGGARAARVDLTQAEARRAAAEERSVEDAVARAVDQAHAAVADAEARAAALAASVERFDELTRVEALALREGSDVQAEYLRALAGLFGARVAEEDARRAVVSARARLARTEGRLDLAWVRTELETER